MVEDVPFCTSSATEIIGNSRAKKGTGAAEPRMTGDILGRVPKKISGQLPVGAFIACRAIQLS